MSEQQQMKIQGYVFDRDFNTNGVDREYRWTVNYGMIISKKNLLENLREYTEKSACNFTIETDIRKYEYQGPCSKFVEHLNSNRFP